MVRVTPVSWLLSLPPDAQQSACSISQGGSAARLGRRVPSSCEAGSTSLAKALHYPSASRESCSISLAGPDSKGSANHSREKSHRKRPDFPQREASVRCRNVPSVAALTLGRFAIVPPRLVMLTPAGARHDAAGSSVRSNRLLDRTLLFTRLSILWCVRLRRSPLPVRML